MSGEHAARIEAGLSRVVQTETELDKVDLEPSRVDELLRSLSPEERILLAASVEPVVRDWVVRWNREMRELRLSITGADLLGLGFEPGPQVGQALTETRRARLDGRIKAEDERQFALALLASASGTT